MKTRLILGMAVLHGVCAGADVAVYLDGNGVVPTPTLARAEKIASSMFAEIGVRVRWSSGKPAAGKRACRVGEETIEVRIGDRLPGTDERDGMARALPYASGGTRIVIGYDRSLFDARPGLLAHVLTHEIG